MGKKKKKSRKKLLQQAISYQHQYTPRKNKEQSPITFRITLEERKRELLISYKLLFIKSKG